MKVNVGVSNRHIHLSQEDVEVLFGKGHKLTVLKDLSQPGQFACEEKLDIVGPKGTVKGIRILGPTRKESQVEVFLGDTFKLGVESEIRDSGDLDGTPGVKLVGPKGEVELDKGVVVAARHIHLSTKEAEGFGLKDRDTVKVETEGTRAVVFKNVLVRVNDEYAMDMHVDMEEANAAGLKNGDMVTIIK